MTNPLGTAYFVCRVAAEFPSPADDYLDAKLDLNSYLVSHPAATFYCRASGDSIANRPRLLLETVDAVIDEIGADKTGARLSPFHRGQDMPFQRDTEETYLYVSEALNQRGCVYLHVSLESDTIPSGLLAKIREIYQVIIIAAGGLTQDNAECLLNNKLIDVAAFGTPYIANPDQVERLQNNWPVTQVTREAFYGGGAEGYIDFPSFSDPSEEKNT